MPDHRCTLGLFALGPAIATAITEHHLIVQQVCAGLEVGAPGSESFYSRRFLIFAAKCRRTFQSVGVGDLSAFAARQSAASARGGERPFDRVGLESPINPRSAGAKALPLLQSKYPGFSSKKVCLPVSYRVTMSSHDQDAGEG
jgi:hypothetical protein